MTDAQGIPRRTIIKSYSRRGNYSTLARVGRSSHARRPIVNVSKLNTESRSTTDVHRGYSPPPFRSRFLLACARDDNSDGPGTSPRACRRAREQILRFAFGIRFLGRPGFSHGQVYQESGSPADKLVIRGRRVSSSAEYRSHYQPEEDRGWLAVIR